MGKKWYRSKLNWLGIGASLVAVGDFITSYDTGTWDFKTVALFITGVATVIIRTYFTATTIK